MKINTGKTLNIIVSAAAVLWHGSMLLNAVDNFKDVVKTQTKN